MMKNSRGTPVGTDIAIVTSYTIGIALMVLPGLPPRRAAAAGQGRYGDKRGRETGDGGACDPLVVEILGAFVPLAAREAHQSGAGGLGSTGLRTTLR